MSSPGIQNFFCEINSALNCFSYESVGKKVVSPSYASAILVPPPENILFIYIYTRAQLCLTLCNSMDYSPSGSSVHGILQARMLESVAIPFSGGSFWPGYQTQVSQIAGTYFNVWAIREAPCILFDVIAFLNFEGVEALLN